MFIISTGQRRPRIGARAQGRPRPYLRWLPRPYLRWLPHSVDRLNLARVFLQVGDKVIEGILHPFAVEAADLMDKDIALILRRRRAKSLQQRRVPVQLQRLREVLLEGRGEGVRCGKY